MMDKKCGGCKYWEFTRHVGAPRETTKNTGVCKRFPPIADSKWPRTKPEEWCWEYAPA